MNSRCISFTILVFALCFSSCSRPVRNTVAESRIPVRIQKPDKIDRALVVFASGTVEAEQTVDLGFQVPGRVARVRVEEGQFVRTGQVLAELEDSDYRYGLQASEGQAGAAEANLRKVQSGTRPEELEQARAAFEKAENDYGRYRSLYERKSMAPVDFARVEAAYRTAKAQFEMAQNGARAEDRAAAGSVVKQTEAQVESSRKRVSDVRLVSPLDGIIARRSIDPGEMVSAGMPVFAVVKLDPARVRVGIPETDIGRIRVGQSARISIPSLGGIEFPGLVNLVGVAADPNSRTYTTKISVPNKAFQLKAGMIAEAGIETSGTAAVVSIPGESIVHDPQGSTLVYVYFPDQKRVFARRVEAGPVTGRGIEVRSGIRGDEWIVVAGQHQVREGSLVEVMP